MKSANLEQSENTQDNAQQGDEKDTLPAGWEQIHGAIWLIGLAILAWQGWWWPGILVLVAISSLTQAGIQLYLKQPQEQKQTNHRRAMLLPEACPNCGGPLDASAVEWISDSVASCPYCATSVKAVDG